MPFNFPQSQTLRDFYLTKINLQEVVKFLPVPCCHFTPR